MFFLIGSVFYLPPHLYFTSDFFDRPLYLFTKSCAIERVVAHNCIITMRRVIHRYPKVVFFTKIDHIFIFCYENVINGTACAQNFEKIQFCVFKQRKKFKSTWIRLGLSFCIMSILEETENLSVIHGVYFLQKMWLLPFGL